MRADKRRARFGDAYRATKIITIDIDWTRFDAHLALLFRHTAPVSAGYHETLESTFPPSIAVGHDRMFFIPNVAEAPTLADLNGPDVIDISANIRGFRAIALPESGPSSARLDWGNLTYTYDPLPESGPSPLEVLVAAARNRRGLDSYYEERDDDVPYDWTDAQRVRPEDYDDPDAILGRIDQVLTETGDQQ